MKPTPDTQCPSHLCRLPFAAEAGSPRFCVAGAMTDDTEADFRWSVDSAQGKVAPTYCVDCTGDLASAELLYGQGALKCMQCGSVFRRVAG